MTTKRLYYTDAYARQFEALVTRSELAGTGARVWLDQTAFYPTSGGQPHDTGQLGAARVLDVVDDAAGGVVHITDAELESGTPIRGTIDWGRRFDHMQQHTGQHVFSAAFERLARARTESFHLGRLSATIDLARVLSETEITSAEDEANRVVWEDRAVAVRFVTAEEAAGMALRKAPSRAGSLRLIDVDGFDLSACGGTHVSRTGAVGVIAVSGWERFRGGTRVEFVCGGRALARFRSWRLAFGELNRLLSTDPAALGSSVERLQSEQKTLLRSLRAAQDELAAHRARALVARGERAGSRLVIVEAIDGLDPQGLKTLAVAAAQAPDAAVALFTTSSPALVVIARHAAVDMDAASVLKSLTAMFGGKGGGKTDLAQGGGLAGHADELTRVARELLKAPV